MRWTTLAEDADAADVVAAIERDVPAFLAELTQQHRERLTSTAPGCSFLLLEDDLPVAAVRAVTLVWDGSPAGAPAGGAGEAVARAGEPGADTLAVLDVIVAFGARGRGIGRAVLEDVEGRGRAAGLERALVLLRPHAKARYPLVPFARYAAFTREDGAPFDPWFRSAWQAGFRPVRGVDRSLVARAELAAWRRWLDVELPGSGPYLVEGAIKPAILETERDEGRYREPHLWVTPGRDPGVGWRDALAAAGVVAGDRHHREIRRRR
ncbi:MAG: GNAT family N-acetyltransferase [Nitriliruptor sp.]|nr:MAG: GNAT family N-acetyltransferase [Nitriliruptor sp.]